MRAGLARLVDEDGNEVTNRKRARGGLKVVDGLRPHDLRHTAVALLIEAGVHPKAIQARMGHASITITLDRYGHIMKSVDEDAAAALDGLRPAATN